MEERFYFSLSTPSPKSAKSPRVGSPGKAWANFLESSTAVLRLALAFAGKRPRLMPSCIT